MKTDVARLPAELSKIPSVSKQLKLDELSTLTKMAARGEVVPSSVITQAPPTTTSVISGGVVVGEKSTKLQSQQNQHRSSSMSSATKKERASSSQEAKRAKTEEKANAAQYAAHAGSALVPLSANSGLRLQQTAEGGLLVATSSGVQYTALQQPQQTTKTSGGGGVTPDGGGASYAALKVPTFVDSSQVYQAATVQLVPVSGQQIMVWPQAAVVQQQQQQPAQQQGGKMAAAPQHVTVVQGSQLISMNAAAHAQKGSATSASFITID